MNLLTRHSAKTLLCSLAMLASCKEDPSPQSVLSGVQCPTQNLTAKLFAQPRDANLESSAWHVQRTADKLTARVHQAIDPSSFTPTGLPGIFSCAVPLTSRGKPGSAQLDRDLLAIEGARVPVLEQAPFKDEPNRLLQDDRELSFVSWTEDLDFESDLSPGMFSTVGGVLYAMPFQPFEGSTFEFIGRFATEQELESAGGNIRIDIGASSFHGVSVLSGDTLTCDVYYSKGAELLFSTSARGSLGANIGLEILIGDSIVWSNTLTPTDDYGTIESWRVPLPGDSSSTPRTLTLRSPLRAADAGYDHGMVHILAPSISRASTAPTSPRPDVILFLADTFRADNLAASGGNPLITPHINAFAEESVYFDSAWSPSSWTLPSQASMLTGVHPARHGAVIDLISLDDRMVTLPEVLGAAGYRTVAVTEGGFVVPVFGMDQGFETFLVGAPLDIEGTLARVRQVLERDDGRPLFLFVQTFRAHSNYIATAEAMAVLPELFGESPDPQDWHFPTLLAQLFETHGESALETTGANGRLSDAIAHNEVMDNIHTFYRGGSNDTDRGFGEFLEIIERAGLGNAPIIFTSDHGEAFGEHNIYGHANNIFEETIRIPLAIRAPGVVPRVSDAAVTLLDLGPTICEIADISAPELWEGRSLVELFAQDLPGAANRRLFSFECPSETDILPAEFALREGPHKLTGSLDSNGELIEGSLIGYDLRGDPGETRPIPFDDANAWMRKLAQGLNEELETLQEALHPPRKVQLSAEEEARLYAMGYLGK